MEVGRLFLVRDLVHDLEPGVRPVAVTLHRVPAGVVRTGRGRPADGTPVLLVRGLPEDDPHDRRYTDQRADRADDDAVRELRQGRPPQGLP